MFSRKGSPELITNVNIKYDNTTEVAVKCPKCGKDLSIKSSNGLMKKGSMIVIGKVIIKCEKSMDEDCWL